MSDLLIALKVDPGTALTTLDHATAKFKEAEQRGNDAAKSMLGVSGAFKSLGQAIQQEQAALGRLNAMHEQFARQSQPLAQGFGRIAEQLAREKSVLEQIRAPQMEYFDTLTALDKLLERNAISTAEYAQQVTRLNRSIEKTPAPKAPTVAGGLGAFGGALLGGGAAAGALAFGHQIEQIGEEYEHLDDTYTNLYNHALKFADAGHSTNSVLAQQGELATTLHTTLAQTMDIYDGVGDALNDMNLSSAQLARITQTVGEAAQLAGRPLASTGDLLNQMVTAMNSGADAGRSLRTVMVQVPELAQLWEKSFHTDQAGLMELAKQGKLTATDLVNALMTTTKGIDALHDKLRITHEDEKQIFDEKVALYRRDTSDFAAVFEAANPKLREFDQQMKAWAGTLDDDANKTHILTDAVHDFGQTLTTTTQNFTKATDAIRGGTAVIMTWKAALDSQKVAADPMVRILGDIETKHRSLAANTKALNELLKEGKISLKDYREEMAALTGVHEDHTHQLTAEEQMLERLHGAYDQAYKDLATVEVLYAKGKISLGEYNDELARNRDILGEPVKSATGGLGSIGPANFGEVSSDKLGAIAAQQQADAYQDALDKAGAAYDDFESKGRDAISGLDSGWKQIVSDATDSGKHIKDAMTGAFSAIEDSLVSMVTKGKLDLGSLGSALEQILVKFAVQQAMGGLTSLFPVGGGMTGFDYTTGSSRLQFPGFATGGDMLVGGAGGPDTKTAIFRVTPGETIRVRTPQQMAAEQASGGGGTTIVNSFNYDPKQFRSMIHTEAMNMIRQNPQAVAALLPR